MADRDSNSSAIGAVNNKIDEAGVNDPTASQIESNGNRNVNNYEEKKSKPRSLWTWFLASLRKYWYLYFIAFLLCVVLAVMLLIYVGIHNIAQDKIDNAKLEVLGISCTMTMANSFVLGINTTLKSGTTKATVSKFAGVMYLEDEPSHRPFVTIDFPSVKNKRFQHVNISEEVQIVDKDALATFNTYLLLNESVRVTVLGHPTVKVPGVSKKYGVTFKKTVTLPGLNGFAGINAYNSSISLKNFTDGTNFHSTTEIPNSSLMTFEIGNITFATFLNGSLVGTTYMDDVTLYPGKNVYPIRSSIAQAPVLNGVQSEAWCKDGVLPFDLSGRLSLNNGQNLTYFTDALAAHNTTVNIDMDTPLRALGLNPKCPSS